MRKFACKKCKKEFTDNDLPLSKRRSKGKFYHRCKYCKSYESYKPANEKAEVEKKEAQIKAEQLRKQTRIEAEQLVEQTRLDEEERQRIKAIKPLIQELDEKHGQSKFKIHHYKRITYEQLAFSKTKDLHLNKELEETIKAQNSGLGVYRGIYKHQREAYEKIIGGKNVVISAPTGTGKTLSFTLPIIQSIINGGSYNRVNAVVISPIKALTSDQTKQIRRFTKGTKVRVEMLTGDVQGEDREKIKNDPPEILCTNFDTIFYNKIRNTSVAALFENFKTLVVDEIHYYSGMHGSNIHHVIKELKSRNTGLQMIGASATIENLDEFSKNFFDTDNCNRTSCPKHSPSRVSALALPKGYVPPNLDPPNPDGTVSCSEKIELIETNQKDGIAHFHMISPISGSFTSLLIGLCKELKEKKQQFLIFLDSKQGAEKLAFRARNEGVKIKAHRAGLSPTERAKMEDELRKRIIDGIVCTPTLELGIDIGSIDVVFSASLVPWGNFRQRMGRAGRRGQIGQGILILGEDPVSNWLKRHPEDFYTDHLVYINPENRRVLEYMEPYRKLNTAYGAERGKLFEKVENYNIRGMGGEVEIKETPLKGIDVNYDTLDKIGFETASLAYKRFHRDCVFLHHGKIYEIIETKMNPNDTDPQAEHYVIVEQHEVYKTEFERKHPDAPDLEVDHHGLEVTKIPYLTRAQAKKTPHIIQSKNQQEKKIGIIEVLYTELEIEETPSTYTEHNLYNDQQLGEPRDIPDAEPFNFRTKGVVVNFEISKPIKNFVHAVHTVEHLLQLAGATVVSMTLEDVGGTYLVDSTFDKFFEPINEKIENAIMKATVVAWVGFTLCRMLIPLEHISRTMKVTMPLIDDTIKMAIAMPWMMHSTITAFIVERPRASAKIFIYDDSGDGESGVSEAIYEKIEETFTRALDMVGHCIGDCKEEKGCSKCTFLMRQCSQWNENLNKPGAIRILDEIVHSFQDSRKTLPDAVILDEVHNVKKSVVQGVESFMPSEMRTEKEIKEKEEADRQFPRDWEQEHF